MNKMVWNNDDENSDVFESGSAREGDVLLDLVKSIYESSWLPPKDSVVLAQRVSYSMDSLRTGINNHMLVVGGSGTGKTRGVVEPNLITAAGSYVVCDPKGYLYDKYRGYLADQGYAVHVLDFAWPDRPGNGKYNPLHQVHSSRDIQALAHIFAWGKETSEIRYNDTFWQQALAAQQNLANQTTLITQ